MASTPAKAAVQQQQASTKVSYLDKEQQLANQAGAITQAELAAKSQATAAEAKISLADIAAQQAELRSQAGDVSAMTPLQLAEIAAQKGEYGAQIGDIKTSEPMKLADVASSYASRGAFWSGRRGQAQDEVKRADAIAVRGLKLAMDQSDRKTKELQLQSAAQLRGIQSQIDSLTRKAQVTTLKADEQQTLDRLQSQKDQIQLQEHMATLQEEQRQTLLNEQLQATQARQQQKEFSKSDLLDQYRAGIITREQYEQGLIGAGYSENQAQTYGAVAAAEYGSPGEHPKGPEAKTGKADSYTWQGVQFSSAQGQSISNPDQFINTYWHDYVPVVNKVKEYLQSVNPNGTISDYVKWVYDSMVRNGTSKADAQKAIQTAHWNISLAWYRVHDQGYPEIYG